MVGLAQKEKEEEEEKERRKENLLAVVVADMDMVMLLLLLTMAVVVVVAAAGVVATQSDEAAISMCPLTLRSPLKRWTRLPTRSRAKVCSRDGGEAGEFEIDMDRAYLFVYCVSWHECLCI